MTQLASLDFSDEADKLQALSMSSSGFLVPIATAGPFTDMTTDDALTPLPQHLHISVRSVPWGHEKHWKVLFIQNCECQKDLSAR